MRIRDCLVAVGIGVIVCIILEATGLFGRS